METIPIPGPIPPSALPAAHLIEWVDKGRVYKVTVATQYPVSQLANDGNQRLAAKVLGHTVEDAMARLMRMLDRVDPDVAKELRRTHNTL